MAVPFMDLYSTIEPIRKEIDEKISSLIENTRFIGGSEIEEFEKEFADFCGMNHTIGCANGTDALFIALKTVGIGQGDTVLIPANTFIATAEAVTMTGATVDFVDIDPDYCTIDPQAVEEYLNTTKKKVAAVIAVHLYGQMADMERMMDLSRKYGFRVIEDSAQAHGASFNDKKPGHFSGIATFSFYPGKNLGAFGDAGAIVVDDEELYHSMKMLVNHGREPGSKYEHAQEGYNMRLDTLQAGILRVKLTQLEEIISLREQKARYYSELLGNLDGVKIPKVRPGSRHVWHLYVIETSLRDKMKVYLNSLGIKTGIHYPLPLHLQPAYSHKKYQKGDFPHAEKSAATCLSLPMWHAITEEQQQEVVNGIRQAIGHA